MVETTEPRTEQGRWLLDHQGLINADGSMRGDSIDLRQSILTIEAEAATLRSTSRDSEVREARGGRGDDANLVTACQDCNLGKGCRST